MSLRDLLTDYTNLQRRRREESAAIEAGSHNNYELYDELHADIADLLIDNAGLLRDLVTGLESLASAVAAHDRAAERDEDDDGHAESLRVAARGLVEHLA